jgi:hypothetical protein
MIFPTYFDEASGTRHIVKDRNHCECGTKYNVFPTYLKTDLKKVQFRKIEEVTCQSCKAAVEIKMLVTV